MIVYLFRVEGEPKDHRLGLNRGDDKRVLEWLRTWLRGDRLSSLTIVGPPRARMSRALIGPLGEALDQGVAVDGDGGDRIGITTTTTKTWVDDLEHERPGAYSALSADDTVIIADP